MVAFHKIVAGNKDPSAAMARVILFLESIGVKVLIVNRITNNFYGECVYNEKLIKILSTDPDTMLLLLLHEAGHWISYLRLSSSLPALLKLPQPYREILAYKCGWVLIRQLNLHTVSKEKWRKFHELDITTYQAFIDREKARKN